VDLLNCMEMTEPAKLTRLAVFLLKVRPSASFHRMAYMRPSNQNPASDRSN
jgi:hypothetical protein